MEGKPTQGSSLPALMGTYTYRHYRCYNDMIAAASLVSYCIAITLFPVKDMSRRLCMYTTGMLYLSLNHTLPALLIAFDIIVTMMTFIKINKNNISSLV